MAMVACYKLLTGVLFLWLVITFGVVSCANRRRQKMASDAEVLSGSQLEFALDLYKAAAKQVSGNLFFSPISLSMSLTMLAAGAKGETQAQILKALHLANRTDDLEKAHRAYSEVLASLDKLPSTFTLSIANKLFLMEQFKVLENYQSLLTQTYRSAVQSISVPAGAKTINDWVSSATNGKIKDLIPPNAITQDTRLVLANAIYFKGLWENKFSEQSTKNDKFYLADGSTVNVPFMNQKAKFKYGRDDELHVSVLQMPYQGNRLAMVVILPDEGVSLSTVEESLTGARLQRMLKELYKEEVIVAFPKFKLEETLPAKEVLHILGLEHMYSVSNADFAGISVDLYVSDSFHKATVEISEEGTEAAAATAHKMMFRCLPMPKPEIRFTADRPFLFLIHDLEGIDSLFFGKLFQPPEGSVLREEL